MDDRPLGCSVFYSTLLPYRFTLKLFTFSWAIGKCVSIFVDKIDGQLKILWLSTFIDKLNLSVDNYRQILSIIDLSTMFSMIDFDRHVTSCLYSNHTETIIKYFVTNLNNHKTQNRSGHFVYWCSERKALQKQQYSFTNSGKTTTVNNIKKD